MSEPATRPLPATAVASEIHAYFEGKLGPTDDEAFKAMQSMDITELETLQAEAEDFVAGGRDDDAQQAGLKWTTCIGRFIA